MSGFALLSIGSRAMAANYAALQTTGHNIANAGVAGYSRQRVETATASARGTASGYIGTGVDVQTVSRAHDQFLTREAANSKALSGMDAARLESLRRLEEVFRPGEQGIGHAAGEFLNSMVDLGSRPADLATRQVVLARAGEVADRFRLAGTQLDALQGDIDISVNDAITRANALIGGIAELNARILAAGKGQPPNDLLDERDRRVSDLSQIVQVKTMQAGDGSTSVFFAGGVALVDGGRSATLRAVPDEDDANRLAIELDLDGAVRSIDAVDLGGGSIAGWLRFQNEDLLLARTTLGQMAMSIAGVVNDQQSLGLDLRTPAGRGAALFDVADPVVQSAQTNARDAGGAFLATVRLEVTDARLLRATEYALTADTDSGTWKIERLSDGAVFDNIATGSEFDGLRIDFGPTPPPLSDRFLLQPVTAAAASLRRAVSDPRALAAAALLSADASTDNTGTATIARLRLTSVEIDPALDAEVVFTAADAVELRDRQSGGLLATGTWTRGQPIEWDGDDEQLTGFELSLDGQPAVGDVFTLAPTSHVERNNTNALAFAELRDTRFIGQVLDAEGEPQGGSTVVEAWSSALADTGVRTQAADSAAQISKAVADQAEMRRAAQAGVNLDEEAARLIQYQQSYQAAAKVLQVAQSVFDTLLQTAAS
jgi:flagellar hook-associated protein 1 FlgK